MDVGLKQTRNQNLVKFKSTQKYYREVPLRNSTKVSFPNSNYRLPKRIIICRRQFYSVFICRVNQAS